MILFVTLRQPPVHLAWRRQAPPFLSENTPNLFSAGRTADGGSEGRCQPAGHGNGLRDRTSRRGGRSHAGGRL